MKMNRNELQRYLNKFASEETRETVLTNNIFDLKLNGHDVEIVGVDKNADGTFSANAVYRAWNPKINNMDTCEKVVAKAAATEYEAKIELYLNSRLK